MVDESPWLRPSATEVLSKFKQLVVNMVLNSYFVPSAKYLALVPLPDDSSSAANSSHFSLSTSAMPSPDRQETPNHDSIGGTSPNDQHKETQEEATASQPRSKSVIVERDEDNQSALAVAGEEQVAGVSSDADRKPSNQPNRTSDAGEYLRDVDDDHSVSVGTTTSPTNDDSRVDQADETDKQHQKSREKRSQGKQEHSASSTKTSRKKSLRRLVSLALHRLFVKPYVWHRKKKEK